MKVGYNNNQEGTLLGKSKIVKFKLTASKVVHKEIIYPITLLINIILVADRALDRKAWKKNAIPI